MEGEREELHRVGDDAARAVARLQERAAGTERSVGHLIEGFVHLLNMHPPAVKLLIPIINVATLKFIIPIFELATLAFELDLIHEWRR